MLADTAATINLPLYATIPLWPLLGAVLIGVMVALRGLRDYAHWPAILGVAASAVLSIGLFLAVKGATEAHESGATHGEGAASADHAQTQPASAPAATSHPTATAAAHDGATEQAAALFDMFTASETAPAHDGEHGAARWWRTYTVYNWLSLGQAAIAAQQWIGVTMYFDALTAVMLVTVTVVSLMVVIYSVGYMRDHHFHPERGYERFHAFLALFVFSMCMLVVGGNFVLLYLGWELVGVCSYLLIGFYYWKPEAAAAAKKAFIVNRIGDLGFAIGIFALFMYMRPLVQPGENPLDFAVVFKYVHELTEGQATLVSLLLFCGAIGKSAQIPLYVWLPDAMEGPSPVSALIHAATMVTAGVYLVARCGPIFTHSPIALDVVMFVGVVGALFAATMAMAQFDMKRILAYSTMSQLAYMFVALGCGAPDSGIFHLYTHAFFKALLFLCAGCVMHAMGGIIDLRQFSGLRQVMPRTYPLMAVGCLALAGFPLLAGFWSKDEIVHAAWDRNPAIGVALLVTAALTAYYTLRMFFLCFHGPLRLPKEAGEHPHDAPAVMVGPLVFLAIGAVIAGYVGVTVGGHGGFLGVVAPHGYFHHYLGSSTIVKSAVHGSGGEWLMYLSGAIAIVAILLAWARYGKAPTADPDAAALGGLWRLWHHKYWVDELYDRVFVRPLYAIGRACHATDNSFVDGVIWVVAAAPRALGAMSRSLQQGALQGYALTMVIGLAILLLLWGWTAGRAAAAAG